MVLLITCVDSSSTPKDCKETHVDIFSSCSSSSPPPMFSAVMSSSSGQLISDDLSEIFSRFDSLYITQYENTLATKSAIAQYDDSYLGNHGHTHSLTRTHSHTHTLTHTHAHTHTDARCVSSHQVTLWRSETSTMTGKKVRLEQLIIDYWSSIAAMMISRSIGIIYFNEYS